MPVVVSLPPFSWTDTDMAGEAGSTAVLPLAQACALGFLGRELQTATGEICRVRSDFFSNPSDRRIED
jgi:hypothetical protein